MKKTQMKGRIAQKPRILKILMLSVLCIFVLAACSGGDEGVSTNIGENGAGNEESDGTSTEAGEGPLEISFTFPLHAELPDMENEYWTMLEEETNVKADIDWIPGPDFQDRIELMLGAGDIPEVIGGVGPNNSTFYNAVQNEMFWDLTPFLDDFSEYPNLKRNADEGVFNISRINGKIYGIPRMRSATEFNIMMRHDWLEELGIPEPTTLEEFKDALIQIVEADPSGEGTVGLAIHDVLGGTTDFPPAFGVYDPTYDEDGGLIRDILTPQYADMVEWFNELYEEGLLPQEFASMQSSQAEDLFSSGRAAAYDRNIYRQWMYGEANRTHTPDAYVRSVELEGPEGYAIHLTPRYVDPMWISTEVPEEKVWEILDFFEWTASEEALTIGEYGFEGVHYNLEDGYPVMTDLGHDQMTVAEYYHFALPYDQGFKARVPSAPREWDEETLEIIDDWEEKGSANQFNWLVSHTWNDIWPGLESEYETRIVQAVIGDITMDEFREYQEELRNIPEMKEAFQELAEAEAEIDFDITEQ